MRHAGCCFGLIVALAGLTAPAFAQTASGPALLNVKEIVLQYTRIGNAKAADMCGVSREDIADLLTKTLKLESLPVVPVIDAKPPVVGVARIDLVPEVVAISTQGGDCTSWVALTAQTQSVVKIPPVDTPRSVIVTYWRSGLLIASNQTAHTRLLNETMQKLGRDFSKQYLLDQPPPLPDLSEENAIKR